MNPMNGFADGDSPGTPRRTGRLPALAAAALLAVGAPLAAQTDLRLWAAQTGPDEATLVWDSVPGALEYRIYLGAPGTVDEHMPAMRLSGSSRRTVLSGLDGLANGVYLLATGSSNRVLLRDPFNPVTRATSIPPISAPDEVTAEATGATAVSLSWTPVPGATAYSILRAVGGTGLRPLCDLCSTATPYVDRTAVSGFRHVYAVAAIFPTGISRRTASDPVTPGATTFAGAPAAQTAGGTTTTAPTTTATTTTPATTSPTTSTSSTVVDTTKGLIGAILTQVAGAVGTATGAVSPPPYVNASSSAPASVQLTWQASPTANVTGYRLSRRINNGAWQVLSTVGPTTLAYTDAFFPTTLFTSGAVWVSYSVTAVQNNTYSSAKATGTLGVQPPAPPTATPTTTGGVPAPTSLCKLDYQRADNMWAAFGRPDGLLGTETISLAPGQDKVFITDWAYEKQKNDGTNYYGSHLRIATNSSTHTIRLHTRTTLLTSWIQLAPGKVQQFQADLMEVFCEN